MKDFEYKKVSIIIPSYNGEKFIYQTIQSCVDQTYHNIEIIVVDDCSEDNSVGIARGFSEKYANISVFENEENLGISENCNKGFFLSSGEFLVFIGQDDKIPNDHVEKILSEFDDKICFVHCNSKIIDLKNAIIKSRNNDEVQKKKNLHVLYELSKKNFINSCGLMIQRRYLQEIGGFDTLFGNFYERSTWIKLAKLGKVKYSTKSISFYRKHETNITNSFNRKEVSPVIWKYKKYCRKMACEKNQFTIAQKILLSYKRIEQAFKYGLKRLV